MDAHMPYRSFFSNPISFLTFINRATTPTDSAKLARVEGLREEKEEATLESRARAKQENRHPTLLLNQDQELLQQLQLLELLFLLKLLELLFLHLLLLRLLLFQHLLLLLLFLLKLLQHLFLLHFLPKLLDLKHYKSSIKSKERKL
jgi:hypothetical protein